MEIEYDEKEREKGFQIPCALYYIDILYTYISIYNIYITVVRKKNENWFIWMVLKLQQRS